MLGWMRGFIKTPWAFALFALLVVSFGVFYSQDPFKGVSGGAILGDGNVGLILDPEGLFEMAESN